MTPQIVRSVRVTNSSDFTAKVSASYRLDDPETREPGAIDAVWVCSEGDGKKVEYLDQRDMKSPFPALMVIRDLKFDIDAETQGVCVQGANTIEILPVKAFDKDMPEGSMVAKFP